MDEVFLLAVDEDVVVLKSLVSDETGTFGLTEGMALTEEETGRNVLLKEVVEGVGVNAKKSRGGRTFTGGWPMLGKFRESSCNGPTVH